MTHKNTASALLHHIDPAERFGIEVKPTRSTCVADFRERPYPDQLRYNERKWAITEQCIESWKEEVRASSVSMFDIFGDSLGDSRRRDAEIAIAVVEDILAVELPRHIATRKREWDAEHDPRKFRPSYAKFEAFFDALDSRRHRETGAVRGHLDDLYLPLRAYSNNQVIPVEKLGFVPVSLTDREAWTAQKRADKAARDAERTAKLQAEKAATAQRLETALLIDHRLHRRSIAPGGAQ